MYIWTAFLAFSKFKLLTNVFLNIKKSLRLEKVNLHLQHIHFSNFSATALDSTHKSYLFWQKPLMSSFLLFRWLVSSVFLMICSSLKNRHLHMICLTMIIIYGLKFNRSEFWNNLKVIWILKRKLKRKHSRFLYYVTCQHRRLIYTICLSHRVLYTLPQEGPGSCLI